MSTRRSCLFYPWVEGKQRAGTGACEEPAIGPSYTYCARHEMAFFAEFGELSPPRGIVTSDIDAAKVLQTWEDRVWEEATKNPAAV